jgi:sortase A
MQPSDNRYAIPNAARSRSRVALWIERFLWIAGCVALGYCAFLWGRAQYDQAQGNWALDHVTMSDRPPIRFKINREGTLVGRIEIPRLDLSAIVFEGTSDGTLSRGVGHLMGSAGPGERGNLVLAGHRDTFFRELRGIRKGDEITITAPRGEFQYQVVSTAVVQPEQTEVLKSDIGATLTLITCYPFRYVGNAPERFVVRATKVERSKDPS